MTEDPIPDDLQEAFQKAIGASFDNWLMGGQAPEFFLNGRAYFIEAICARVSRFKDAMPDHAYDELCTVLRHFPSDVPEKPNLRGWCQVLARLMQQAEGSGGDVAIVLR